MFYPIYALPQHQLTRCRVLKYDKNQLLLTKNIQLANNYPNNLEQNILSKIKKFIKSIHRIIHWGIDILSLSNEIIDLTNN
ncbi:MAG: hypothetical protein Q8841_01955 [Candidatus Phytoplasma australasiaticum]|nr:hypothetical protein [Candidatus Phytoplasma australasiaticum]MDV3152646.1 hypothetical protein [Candidatus Phytoplasma australasiaticum]MDV3175282.1 hypothetical protein [Candidatus Phytoplasma australasiaticum]MDV3180312.1 hypothetical protein [Candidatus Phytoplasma australasiaticum]MDV3191700.1 hypothetical protein [Candidatus Phytoplasma australasiaticum]